MSSPRPPEVKERVDIVGGVYRERCRLPYPSDDTLGSGGRAAAVIAGLGLQAVLHTAVDKQTRPLLASLAETFKFDVVAADIQTTRQFQYEHGLSTPTIWPSASHGTSVVVDVTAENALVFGMIEGPTTVSATRVVYDPQNPVAPDYFLPPAKSSPRIAYVLNGSEAKKLTGEKTPEAAARKIASDGGAVIVVVKLGPRGALVFEDGQYTSISAYLTRRVWPIGSGDVFAAVFAARWAGQKRPAAEAADQASRAAALYVNSQVLPIPATILEESSAFPFEPLRIKERVLEGSEFHVYLAGPFFNIGQRWLIEEARSALQGMGLRVFSPLHDVGMGPAHDVAPKDIEGLKSSRTVLALVDGLDPGTIFEIGYARSLSRPVIALAESTPEEQLKMLEGTGCDIVNDFVTSIYRVLWAARA